MESTEEWRPVVGYEGSYEVSNLGRVRSLDRTMETARGPWRYKGQMLKPSESKTGYMVVVLPGGNSRKVHQLVLEAFIGPRPPEHETRHLDGNRLNNALSNLCWGTSSENEQDVLRHGTHNNASKTHCVRGHAFSPENTVIRKDGGRWCRECGRARSRDYVRRKRASRAA